MKRYVAKKQIYMQVNNIVLCRLCITMVTVL